MRFCPPLRLIFKHLRILTSLLVKLLTLKSLKLTEKEKTLLFHVENLLRKERQDKKREILSKIKPGETRRGMVKNITDYGAFIDFDGLDGLLHITDMSWGRVSHPSEMVKTGEEITVCIIDIDTNRERVSLGLKQLSSNPWDDIEGKFPINAKVRGKVVNLFLMVHLLNLKKG